MHLFSAFISRTQPTVSASLRSERAGLQRRLGMDGEGVVVGSKMVARTGEKGRAA